MADIKYSSYVDEYSFKASSGIKHGSDDIKASDEDIKNGYNKKTDDVEEYPGYPFKGKERQDKEIKCINENDSSSAVGSLAMELSSSVTEGLTDTLISDADMDIWEADSSEESASSFFGARNYHQTVPKSEKTQNESRKGRFGTIAEGIRYIEERTGHIKERDRGVDAPEHPAKSRKSKIDISIGKELKGLKTASVALLPFASIAAAILLIIIIVISSVSMLISNLSVADSNLSEREQVIWQYLKEEGFSDYAIAGVLGCYGSESGHNPDIVEGEYIKGVPDRAVIMADLDGYCREYLFPYYQRRGVRISRSGYMYNGKYYPGLGLAQWTGVRAWRLLHYDMSSHSVSADYNNMQWNDLTVQLDFMIHYEMSDSFWNNYKNISPEGTESDEDCVRRTTEVFFSNVEMPGNHEARFLNNRKAQAVKAYNQARTFGGDGTFIWPCPASHRITSYFGGRSSPGGIGSTDHKGIDIGAPIGSEVVAAAGGTVVYTGYNSERGNFIKIDHGNGYMTIYQHLNGFNCNKGDIVYAGDVIGYSGNTGHSTGPHLHFEILMNSTPVNPMEYY